MSAPDDLWESLLEAQLRFEAENPDPWLWPAGPLHQAAARERLAREAKNYEQGEGMALLAAIRICSNHDLPLPEWAAAAYISAYDRVLNCEVGSWDAAFGQPYPGKHLAALRKRRHKRLQVWNRINELTSADPDRPLMPNKVDEGIFAQVGREVGLGRTLCAEFYYEAQRLLRPFPEKN